MRWSDRDVTKVGDTITATVAPAKATNVTYQWYTGASKDGLTDAISGATTASYTVTEADAGKFIGVVVKGDNDSTATAVSDVAVQAEEKTKVEIISAEQKSGTQIEVKFNKKVSTADFTFEVKRGTTAQTVETSVAEDGMSAILTLGTKMGAADYDITVTNKKDAEDTATFTLKAEIATLSELQFQGENLIITNTAGTKAAVGLRGVDQFGGEVVLTSSNLQLYSSVGGTTGFDNDTQRVTLEVAQAILLNVGNTVTITAMYNNGTGYIQKAQPLTVAQRAYVDKMEFGDLATTKAALKDKKVTLENFASNTYYLPVTSAIDQYGNKISYKELNSMITNQILFIIPNNGMNSYYAYTEAQPFDELSDGTVILNLKNGTLLKPGTFQVSATSVGGGSFTKDVTLEDNPWIETLNVSIPEVYDGTEAELTLTAVDQYGESFDLYDKFIGAGQSGASIALGDTNNMTTNGSTIDVTKGTLYYTKDTNKKTVKLTYKNASNGVTTAAAADDTVVFTMTSAKPTVGTQSVKINTAGYAAGIKGMASDVNTNLSQGAKIDFTDVKKILFLDSYGAVMVKGDANMPTFKETVALGTDNLPSAAPAGYASAIYTVKESDVATVKNLTAGVYTADDAQASETITVTLYPVKKNATTGVFAWDTPVTKTISLTCADATKLTYTISVKDSKTLHVGEAKDLVTNPYVEVELKALDSAKTEVAVPTASNLVSVTTKNGLSGVVATDGKSAKISYDASKEIKGKGEDIISATINGVADPVTCKLPYDDAVSVGTKSLLEHYDVASDDWKEFNGTMTNPATLWVNTKGTTGANNYRIAVQDQYGDDIIAAKLAKVSDSIEIAPGTASYTCDGTADKGIRLSYQDKYQVAIGTAGNMVTLKGTWGQGGSSTSGIKSYESLVAAIATANADKSANTITIDNDITLTDSITVPVGDTLVVPDGKKLVGNDNDVDITVNGTLNVKAGGEVHLVGHATAADAAILTVAGTGTLTNNGLIKGLTANNAKIDVAAGGVYNENGATTNGTQTMALVNNGTVNVGASSSIDVTEIVPAAATGNYNVNTPAQLKAFAELDAADGTVTVAKDMSAVGTTVGASNSGVIVPAGITLTVPAGVTFATSAANSLTVKGTLKVTGTGTVTAATAGYLVLDGGVFSAAGTGAKTATIKAKKGSAIYDTQANAATTTVTLDTAAGTSVKIGRDANTFVTYTYDANSTGTSTDLTYTAAVDGTTTLTNTNVSCKTATVGYAATPLWTVAKAS